MSLPSEITVVGMGSMGASLARTLVKAGKRITIWNRTATRPAVSELVAAGAVFEPSPTQAVSCSSVIIFCLLSYETLLKSFGDVTTFSGRTVFNFTNGTPRDAREMCSHMREKNVAFYIDGGIMTSPPLIGGPESFILCSGETEEKFNAVSETVALLGRPEYVGEDPGAAALYDLSALTCLYGMYAGGLTGMAMMQKQQRKAGTGDKVQIEPFVRTVMKPMIESFTSGLTSIAQSLDKDDFPGGEHPMEMQNVVMQNIIKTCKEDGIDTRCVDYLFSLVGKVVASGGGDGSIGQIANLLHGS